VTSLVEGARRLVRRGPTIGERLEALSTAASVGRGRFDNALLDRTEAVVRRGSGRLAVSGDHTVVALAGATGSGKSSIFNALTGAQLVRVGVRRPTTAVTSGASWGADDASELFAWLGVQSRHQVADGAGKDLDGLVLLDLPDHDSTEVAHHLEVDRLVELVDLLAWVVDPQKYADAALHERYLRRLATHQDVMLVVLNHVDELEPGRRPEVLSDLRRRLEEDGLSSVPVVATSVVSGDGVGELRALIATRVKEKRAAADRLTADVLAVAGDLQAECGRTEPGELRRADRAELVDAFADAAGVPTVARAVERSTARRGSQHTGWPFTAWLSRLRPDPLRRLHLDVGSSGKQLTELARASTPEPTRVQRARVDMAVREAATGVGSDLAPVWADAVRRASVSRLDDLNDALDRAVVGTDLGVSRTPVWWRVARLLQLFLAACVVVGALWLGGLAVLGYLQVPVPDTPQWHGLPVPTMLLLAGLAGGLALALIGRVVNRLVARSRARSAERRLRSAISAVTEELVVRPIDDELSAYTQVRRALDTALAR
jgi:GTP-binding protein EngB required for normal cell division